MSNNTKQLKTNTRIVLARSFVLAAITVMLLVSTAISDINDSTQKIVLMPGEWRMINACVKSTKAKMDSGTYIRITRGDTTTVYLDGVSNNNGGAFNCFFVPSTGKMIGIRGER